MVARKPNAEFNVEEKGRFCTSEDLKELLGPHLSLENSSNLQNVSRSDEAVGNTGFMDKLFRR